MGNDTRSPLPKASCVGQGASCVEGETSSSRGGGNQSFDLRRYGSCRSFRF